MHLSINPAIVSYLPIMVAVERGYFQKAGLDVNVDGRNTSAVVQLASLAKGDIDVVTVSGNPALFNQAVQGFDAKIVAGFNVPKAGRLSDAWLTVVAPGDQIKDLKDLKGKSIEVTGEGSVLHFLALEALQAAGLTDKDVTLNHKAQTIPDMLVVAKAKGSDVVGMVDPIATQAEKDGLVKKWKTYVDIAPWYQPAQIAVSGKYLQANRAAVEKFVEVYVATSREVDASNGVWTDDLVNIAAKSANVQPQVIKDQGGVPYYDPNGVVSVDSLQRVEDLWVQTGLVKQKIDAASLVDPQVLQAALGRIGKTS
ncbi:MAG: ABC transporter substrate-binding protein [Chloroflexi bacterium]|nr:ABC transporter substrate-binding protein [Chloroflexota bacterium]